MSKYDHLLARPVRTMKHNGKVRTLEGNEESVKKINGLIDDLYTYMPAQQCVAQIRQHFIKAKKYYADDAIKPGILESVETNYGRLNVVSTVKGSATNKEMINDSLKEIGMYEMFDEKFSQYVRNFLKIDTTAVKLDNDVIANLYKLNTILDYNIEYCKIKNGNLTEDDEIRLKFISARGNLLKDIITDQRKYMDAYRKLREAFTEVTNPRDKIQFELCNFPTTYEYRGVVLMWDSILTRVNYSTLVQTFLTEYDYKHSTTFVDKFRTATLEVSKRKEKYFIVFLLDDIDYLDQRDYQDTEFC